MGRPANTSDALAGHSARGKYFLEGGGRVFLWCLRVVNRGRIEWLYENILQGTKIVIIALFSSMFS